jgi:hypothetical protein
MDSNEEQGVCYAQPVTFEDRVQIASDFVQRCEYEIPLAIDRIDNAANELYAGWPERLYIVEADGTIAYKGKTGPFGYHPEEVAAWLLKRFLPQASPPSDVTADRIAREPLSVKALEYSDSRERWRLSIDRSGRATVGRESDAKSQELTPESAHALREAIAEQGFFSWKEASGEPRVDGRTRSLSVAVGDDLKIVHLYGLSEQDARDGAAKSPDAERFEHLWDLLRSFDP